MFKAHPRRAVGVLLTLTATASLLAQEKIVPVAYDLKVTIEPKAGSIAVRGKVDIPRTSASGKLQFGLHDTFRITALSVDGRSARFAFQPEEPTPINPATRDVLVTLPPDTPPGKVQLNIQYNGKLKHIPEFGTYPDQKQALDDQINSRMVELANYSSWYPQFFPYGRPIDITLEVSLPKGWIAICSGKKLDETVRSGRALTRWSSLHDTDILITAAPNYKQRTLRLSGAEVDIYYTQLPNVFIDKEGTEIAAVMDLFTKGLGETNIPSGSVKHVFSPKRKGQGRAGIARSGMIVTSEGRVADELARDPNFSLFQDVAHEIAHFWWNFGAGQGDWINEAFSEYSSAIAIEKIRSEAEFQRVLQNYSREVRELPADAPPLARVPFDGSGFVIRYYKGSLMLNAFRDALGEDSFYAAAHEFFQTYKGQSIGTAEFRTFWNGKMAGKQSLVDMWLDSPGGLPDFGTKQNSSR